MSQRLCVLLLASVTLLAMGRACGNDFIRWDDPINISHNEHFNPPDAKGILHFWAHPYEGMYIPVTYTVWGLLAFPAQLNQPDTLGATLNPWIYHTANVLVHILCAWVVFKILLLLIRDDRAAMLGALLFALHPVQVEAVAWATGMKDVLSGLLALTSIWQYIRYAQSPPGKKETGAYLTGTVCLILGILAKPSAMVAPAIAGILDVTIVGRSWRQAAKSLAPWLGLSLVCMIWTKLFQPAASVAATPIWARPLVAGDALAFYLSKLAWPANLCIDYARRPAEVMRHAWFYSAWLIPAAIAGGLVWMRKRSPWPLAAGLVFLAGVLPMLGFVQFLFQYYSTVADRFLYLAMLGPAMGLAWTATKLSGRIFTIAAGIGLGLLGIRSSIQCGYWRDGPTLFRHGLAVSPDSFSLHNNLGLALQEQGNVDAAIVQFRESIRLNPQFMIPEQNLAQSLWGAGRLAEAEQQVRRIIEMRKACAPEERAPDRVIEDYNSLGEVLLAEGKYGEAIAYFQTVLRANPHHAEAAKNLQNAIRLEHQPPAPPATRPVNQLPPLR